MSLSMILKFFFNFGRFEPCDSYKLYSYKKESVYLKPQAIENSFKRAYGEVEDNIIIYIERLKS